jgi:4-alpha-glucanotransferase
VPGPANDFFDVLKSVFPELPIVAEDLGIIDDPVRKLRDNYEIPGMRILQFAFGDDMADSEYIPHRLTPNAVLLTGTHDNDTTRSWFKKAGKTTRRNLRRYTGQQVSSRTAAKILSRMAYATVCNTVILPMQDVIGLGGTARMNNPGASGTNWQWRLQPGEFTKKMIRRLDNWVKWYGRQVETADDENNASY